MIPRIPASPRSPRAALFLALSLLGLTGCQDRAADGGTTDGTSTVAFYLPDGKPAVNARVQVFASSDTTRMPRAQAFTDAQGRVKLPVLDANYYNLMARDENGLAIFQDSLQSDGRRMEYPSDTLVSTGVVTGRVRVQPQHDPRIVWIALLGAGTYLNVDDSGRFRIEGVPEGKFTLAGFTKTEGYTTTFEALRVRRDSVSDIGTLDMVFSGLPVVRNLEARFDTLAGLVHLRWDSIPLRETWRYTVRRDGWKVGETTGPRWIDTVSDEYPADVPSEGRHEYQVVVSDAMFPGPVWETIEMRIVSAYLYQEVKVNWTRKAEFPWPSGRFEVETVDGILHAWRSADRGTQVRVDGDSTLHEVKHSGLIEHWESRDSGSTWRKVADSLGLGMLPKFHQGRWWAVREKEGAYETWPCVDWQPTPVCYPKGATKFYDTLTIVTSGDGMSWDSVARLPAGSRLSSLRFELVGPRFWLVGSREGYMLDRDEAWWSLDASGWTRSAIAVWQDAIGEGMPSRGLDCERRSCMEAREFRWMERSWLLATNTLGPAGSRTWTLNGDLIPTVGAYDARLDNFPRILPLSVERMLLFAGDSAISMDSSLTTFHALSWPGRGFHRELLWGGRILSISDAGVFLGRILSGLEGGDPRGTWVKKTEVPSRF